nr:protein nrt1/ ptr family 6.3 [Quercus suber]
MILGGEAMERLTTLGIAVNLVTYLTATMHLGNATSANIVTNFLGTSFMLCLLGGFIADTFLGRYRTIAIFASVQATGVTILTISTVIPSLRPPKCAADTVPPCIPASGKQLAVLDLALYLTALGTGGLKSSVSGQPGERMGLWNLRVRNRCCLACRKRRLELPSDSSLLFNDEEGQRKKKQRLPHTRQLSFLDKAAIKDPNMAGGITAVNKWYLSTLTDVEEVKLIIRMLPIWASTIMFWTVYAQMTTFSVSQATTMDRRIGSFQIPAASLTVFFVGSILLTVPIYDRIIVPTAGKVLKNPHGLTPLQRIGVGLVFSIFAMVAAAFTEVKRLKAAQSHGLANNPTAEIPLSVFWLVPQFFFVGSGEAFTYIGQLDFFLRECPKGMKTLSTGLFLSTLSLGFFVSSLLVSIVRKVNGNQRPWLADNLNQGKLYDFYWLLAILSALNLVIYLFCAKWYVYKDKRLAEEGIELEETELSCHA